jgi:single-stranded-DNA-specific exonuclease
MHKLIQRGSNTVPFDCPEPISPLMHQLLMRRGIDSPERVRSFLNPDAAQLRDPFLLNDMKAAVEIIQQALELDKKVTVYGDYDVDGVCASSILSMHLRAMGFDVNTYIPSRHHEGYGLNMDAIRKISEQSDLLITVDCGVTSIQEVALAHELGLKVIVTDHHQPGTELPQCPVINPVLSNYPFPFLCGAGTAFKLVCALSGFETAQQYLDLAALATVADVVPLQDENRVLVRLGLKQMNTLPRPGIAALIQSAGLQNRTIGAGNIAFQLAPRINAGGRIGDASRGLELLTSADRPRIQALAAELEAENTLRKQDEQRILAEARLQLEHFDFIQNRIIVLCGEDWNSGIIGLAASRLVEQYHFPVILLARQQDTYVGSCRSIPGINIHAALSSCADLFLRFGGHKQAAGLTLPCSLVPELIERLNRYLTENISPEIYIPSDEYDMELNLSDLTEDFVHQLDQLQPTGFGNPSAVFLTPVQVSAAASVGADGAHLKMTLKQQDCYRSGMLFGAGQLAERVRNRHLSALYVAKLNTWMNRTNVECELKALAESNAAQNFSMECARYPALLRLFLTKFLYNRVIFSKKIRPAQPEPLTDEAAMQFLKAHPQGTLMMAMSPDGARRALGWLHTLNMPDRFDLHIGAWPEDPRCFNSLAFCPTGQIPAGYRRLILLDWPEEAETAHLPDMKLYSMPDDLARQARLQALEGHLPSVDELREVYRLVRSNAIRLSSFQNQTLLFDHLGKLTGMEEVKSGCALMVLSHMGLIGFEPDSANITLLPMKKARPEQDEMYVLLQNVFEYDF